MTPNDSSTAPLSEDMAIVLDYYHKYQAEENYSEPSEKFASVNIRSRFPLFLFLFESATALDKAFSDLERNDLLRYARELNRAQFLANAHRATEACIKNRYVEILRRIPLGELWEIVESADRDDNVRFLEKWLAWRDQYILVNSRCLSQQYARARRERWGEQKEKHNLVEILAETGDLGRMKVGEVGGRSIVLAWYCTDSIVPRRQVQLGFAVLNAEAEHAGQLAVIDAYLEEYRSDILVLVMIGRQDGFRRELDARLGRRKVVVLDEADLKHIALS